VVKAVAAQQAGLESSVPDGYQSIGTDAAPIYLQVPVELNVATPAPGQLRARRVERHSAHQARCSSLRGVQTSTGTCTRIPRPNR